MNSKQISIIKQQLFVKNGEPVVSSLTIAEAFGKQHKHVLRDIEALDCSQEFNRSNFGPIFYTDSYGREQRAYEMTKNGFMFLVMGYSGEKAGAIKEGYIYAFDLLLEECASGMAITRDEAIAAFLLLQKSAAQHGHPANFLPKLADLRLAGLSCVDTGKVLDSSKSTVADWTRKLKAEQLCLPGLEARS